jgi:iron-regulated transporter 1
MLSYLKSELLLSDFFISFMRGICIVASLLGTVAMPLAQKRLGLERTGAWSIWYVDVEFSECLDTNMSYFRLEAFLLIPVVICFYVLSSHSGAHKLTTALAIVLFGSLAISRMGLYAFDLVQVQCLQLELQTHPKRNKFTSLQIAMQSASDLLKWAVVLVFNRPDQ